MKAHLRRSRGGALVHPKLRFALLVAVMLTAEACTTSPDRSGGDRSGGEPPVAPGDSAEVAPSRFLKDACSLPPRWIELIDRGWDGGRNRAADLILVPNPPHFTGSFINTSHSGPYRFLQEVPFVVRGPGHIRPLGSIGLEREVTLADIAPTYAHLLGFDWGHRDGRPVADILEEGSSPPKLILTISIDGGGWNVLDRWPGSWPNLSRLIHEGASVENATTGSSPSITPATHTNISTGTFPKVHGVTAIAVRQSNGRIVGGFSSDDTYTGALVEPTLNLRTTTIGDDWDLHNGNRALVGMISAGNYPLGMLGRGGQMNGGDKDIWLMPEEVRDGSWTTQPRYYRLPGYINDLPGPQREILELDRADGAADGRWMGHDLTSTRLGLTPAAALYEARVIKELLAREGFGENVPDLFYVHFKSPDHVGHKWNMISREMPDVLASVDEAIGSLVKWLDRRIGSNQYVILVTADHGQTPLDQGGWAILRSEVVADVQARFDETSNATGIVQRTSATSAFINVEEMKRNHTTPGEIATFLSGYTIGQNVPEGRDVPPRFEGRERERIFRAVFPGRALPRVVRCAATHENS